ncbi:hypothetical protein A8135_09385 [Legionella jamestowniensis]|uniref:Leucine-rich repeat-containing protein n=1 Tax=Legionella jamestowniensis TaxID=455 RepID=A0ABX2XWS5_9GAMM|nr:hypothetical protein A8135_09385 [Legionella jamestowniensis]
MARKSSDELVQILSAIPDTVINLSLRGNLLHNRKNGFLAVVLAAIPKGVRFLDLSLHNFSEMNANELAQGFAALPPNVTSLNLGLTNLERLSVDSLRQLKNSLPHIRTIYLGYNEISAMSPAQRCALKEIFPNVKQIIFLDSKGKEELAGRDLRTNANLARGLEFNTKVPSLADQCAFFTKNSTGITDLSSLPLEMQERVNSF